MFRRRLRPALWIALLLSGAVTARAQTVGTAAPNGRTHVVPGPASSLEIGGRSDFGLSVADAALEPGQPVRATVWVPADLPEGAGMTILVRAPSADHASGDSGASPPTGPISYLKPDQGWSNTPVQFASPPAFTRLALTLPSEAAGAWVAQVEITDASGGLLAFARRTLLVARDAVLYLAVNRPIAGSSGNVTATLITSAGTTPRHVKLAAWLTTPAGTRLGLPGRRDDTIFVYDGESRSERLELLDHRLATVGGTGAYTILARLYDGDSGGLLSSASAGVDVCDTPGTVEGTVEDASGKPIGGDGVTVEVTAFDVDENVVTASGPIDGTGHFSLSVVPGTYNVSAVVIDGTGLHRAAAPSLVQIGCKSPTLTVTLKEAS